MGGLPTDNFAKQYLLEAFLVVNDFDIVVLGETHLTSQLDEDDLEIDGYSIKRCDHPDGKPRGGIAVYYKSDLPELTKLPEYPGSTIADTSSLHGLIQIIDKPTNFEPHKIPRVLI